LNNKGNMARQNLMQNTYATKDLHFAAFLQVNGMIIEKLEQYGKGEGRQNPVYFIFADRKECEKLESVFWNGIGDGIMGNLKDYSATIKDLKNRISSIAQLVKREEDSFGEAVKGR